MAIEYKDLIESLAKKNYAPVYLLMGEEPYFIDKVSDYIEDHFFENEADKDFNFQLLYGKDTTVNQIVAFAKEYPMASNYRLVIIREAQNLDNMDYLAEYAKNPQKQTVLVICYKEKKLEAKTAFYKAVTKNGTVFDSAKVYDNKLPDYIKTIANEKGFKIEPSAVNLLGAHIGVNLSRIDNEIEKLVNVVPPKGEITVDIIEKYIGISREYNVYEFVLTVIARNVVKTHEILNYFSANPKNFEKTKTIPALYTAFYHLLQYHFSADKSEKYLEALGVFWKNRPIYINASSFYSIHKIVNIMHLLRKYDLMTKGGTGVNIEEPELMKELVFQIFYM
jgi:DNA polymerase-3 subunit delta